MFIKWLAQVQHKIGAQKSMGVYYLFWLLIHVTNVCWTPGIILRAGDTIMNKKALMEL